MEDLIFDIEKFAVHDGPGIRTVVFMKGCPLHCIWCHNPESQSFGQELLYDARKCMSCGRCVQVCQQKCHSIVDGAHIFNRAQCIACGRCASNCPAEALEAVGKSMSINDVMNSVLADKVFYDNSNGGLTLSGGEPLAHFDFTKALLEAAKNAGIHTCIETCGYAAQEKVRALLPCVDLWLWDVKSTPDMHRQLTGVESTLILENLRMIDEAGAKICLRCPLIPGINDSNEHLQQIADLANSLKGCQRIDIEPYHPLGEGKALKLGREMTFHAEQPSASRVMEYYDFLKKRTSIPIHKP
ncbi:MAG: glycyl-radical enzyme activating protein [Victivallales bacterium]|nr:glycyl-radical enzyme activating protein [Victivallales bacterium]